MAITTAAGTGVVITSAAKNGTLGSQSGATSTQIIFDTALTTNNGNLANTSFIGRLVIVRRGTGTEETRYMTAQSGTTVTVHEPWIVQPASSDTYDVSITNIKSGYERFKVRITINNTKD